MSWRPRTSSSTGLIDPVRVAGLAALFDDGRPVPQPGDPLPPLWHWVALPSWAPSAELDVDGHPVRGDFLPPISAPRRMFAGGTVHFPGELTVGERVRSTAVVESVTEKSGRTGPMTLVVVATTLFGSDDAPAVIERQNLIYRAASSPTGAVASAPTAATLRPAGPPLTPLDAQRWSFRTDPTLLLRFSALTANAHRIHYDWPYATHVEGYPGLVVHGPLMTLALAQTARARPDARPIVAVHHRNRAPLFCGEPAHIAPTAQPDTVGLTRDDGTLCTTLTITQGDNS